MAGSQAIALIKQRINIVDLIGRFLTLRQVGGRYVAPCPFHQETKPSFSVNPDGFFYCFGCQKSGDIFDFWMEYNGVGFRDALVQLAAEAGVELDDDRRDPQAKRMEREKRTKRQNLMHMYRIAQAAYQRNLQEACGEKCREYMASRGIPDELAKRFGLGWAEDDWNGLTNVLKRNGCDLNLAMEGGLLGKSHKSGRPYDPFRARLMFPIRTNAGDTVAFGGRIIDPGSDAPKYVNSSDSPIYTKGDHLYGLDVAAQSIRVKRRVFLTEGYMDVLTLHQFGYTNAVGGLGTALTDKQVQRILGYAPEIFLLYDGDNAGRKAALAASGKFLALGAKTRVILQPEGEDIDSLLRTQGTTAFDELTNQAVPALAFCAQVMHERSQMEAIRWCREFVKSLRIPELISPAITYLSHYLGFAERELREGTCEDMENQDRFPQRQAQMRAQLQQPAQLHLTILEKEILRVAVRYPDRMGDIRTLGADMFLHSPQARNFWNLLESNPSEDAGYALEGAERAFWDKYRGMEAPPRTERQFQVEMSALQALLDSHYDKVQASSLSAVFRQNNAADTSDVGMEFLGAMNESLTETKDEQS